MALTAALKPSGPLTTTRCGFCICDSSARTSSGLRRAFTQTALSTVAKADATSTSATSGKGAAAAACAGVTSTVQRASEPSLHQPASSGTRSASSERHEYITCTGVLVMGGRGPKQLPALAWCSTCGTATTPVPATSSSTLACLRLMYCWSRDRLGTWSVFIGRDSHTTAPAPPPAAAAVPAAAPSPAAGGGAETEWSQRVARPGGSR
mmetsp:Transcript_18196/g.52685  ORF Transcript_18196/g.52685 Transcript_18196/m.52685 type:complete len:208 (-) Transcript_18196:1352-1975(-)